jgi:hypothetical protein
VFFSDIPAFSSRTNGSRFELIRRDKHAVQS